MRGEMKRNHVVSVVWDVSSEHNKRNAPKQGSPKDESGASPRNEAIKASRSRKVEKKGDMLKQSSVANTSQPPTTSETCAAC